MRKAYLAIKYHEDQRNRDQIERLTTLLATHGVETICIARDVEQWGTVHLAPQALMEISFAEIDASDVVIVELSEKGVGLGIEAGYAYAQRIPIITLAWQGSDISATLQGISSNVFLYPSYDALDQWLARWVSKQIGYENRPRYSRTCLDANKANEAELNVRDEPDRGPPTVSDPL